MQHILTQMTVQCSVFHHYMFIKFVCESISKKELSWGEKRKHEVLEVSLQYFCTLTDFYPDLPTDLGRKKEVLAGEYWSRVPWCVISLASAWKPEQQKIIRLQVLLETNS